MLTNPEQTALSQVVLFEDIQVPLAQELPLVLKEPTCGRRPEELTGVGEVGVWTHDDLWMPVGEDGIQVVEVPPLDSGSCKFHRFPGHALECSDAEYR